MERKIVGVLSGKGGVGKTSIAASLASIAKKDLNIKVIAVDCDVDAPNLSIILPPEDGSSISKKSTYTTLKAKFIENLCTNCKQCIDDHFCEFNALYWNYQDSKPNIDFLKCEGCGACKVLCSTHAFEIYPVKSGEIISYNSIMDFPLVYGKTRLGSTTSGKLVTETKEFLNNLKEFKSSNLIFIDGPPGIGCPVISTISNLNYIITICEPTPSGLHDLIRIIEVIQQFNIPFGLIINKSDLESPFQDNFKKYISETNYQILGRIPFDLNIPEAMSFAKPVIDFAPDSVASLAIRDIYDKLKNIIWDNS